MLVSSAQTIPCWRQPEMNRKTPKEIGRTPVARSNDRLLDDPGNEDPGSQLDAPVPLRPSTGAQQEKPPRPSDGKPR
mgnify:FL=1|jgi:hypothetical protein